MYYAIQIFLAERVFGVSLERFIFEESFFAVAFTVCLRDPVFIIFEHSGRDHKNYGSPWSVLDIRAKFRDIVFDLVHGVRNRNRQVLFDGRPF